MGRPGGCSVAGGLCFKDALILTWERARIRDQRSSDHDAFEELADGFNFYPPNLPLVCSLSGDVVPVHRSLGGSYWREHCFQDAAVVDSLALLHQQANDYVLEIGPPNTDLSHLQPVGKSNWLSSLTDEQDPTRSLLSALAQFYVSGAQVDFRAFDAPWQRKRISLPTYPFQKKRYWITEISDYLEQHPDPATT